MNLPHVQLFNLKLDCRLSVIEGMAGDCRKPDLHYCVAVNLSISDPSPRASAPTGAAHFIRSQIPKEGLFAGHNWRTKTPLASVAQQR
jgi:hypothetical protein